MSASNLRMITSALVTCGFALVLASCLSMPTQKDEPSTSSAQAQKRITCESLDEGRKTCEADLRGYRIVDVNEISDADCDIGRSYGYSNSGVWVDKGCRAEFVFNRINSGQRP